MVQTTDTYKATVEETQCWASALDTVATRIGTRLPRAEPRQRATAYLRGLLSPMERKHSWQLAEQAGEEPPYGMHHLLGRAAWSAAAVRDDLPAYVVEHLGDPDAVLSGDEPGFLKKGPQSVGVARPDSGPAGRVENCQRGVLLVYATQYGRTLLDRELSLPQEWTAAAARCAAAGVLAAGRFATKPPLARQLLARVLAAGGPRGWGPGDTVYGNDWRMRAWLEERRLSYVLGVTAQYRIFTGQARAWAAAVVG
jgi:SRSO17 transposase